MCVSFKTHRQPETPSFHRPDQKPVWGLETFLKNIFWSGRGIWFLVIPGKGFFFTKVWDISFLA